MTIRLDRVRRLCARGNFVAVLSEATFESAPRAQGDLLRIDNGQAAEHWDVAEPTAPKEEWANGGKL